ncbi:MAG TPA: dipeptidase [Terriglobales bacterium]|nr:dipeptidase [Terriglobales bacterium]
MPNGSNCCRALTPLWPPFRPASKLLHRVLAGTLLLAGTLGWSQSKPAGKAKPDARALHNSAIVVDTHADTPQRFLDQGFDMATVTPVSEGMVDLSKVKEGNLGAEFFSIWVDPVANQGHFAHHAFSLIDSVYQQAARHPEQMVMAYSADDIVRARRGPHKRLATLMGLEGGHAIENDLGVLRDFYRLGVRYMTLTWSNTNEWADSSGDIDDSKVQHHDGLTPFGQQVVLEMNRLGMMVDISHVSDKTFYDAVATSRAPVIASHSSARALCNHPRNMTDDMLRAVAKNDGVVMVNFFAGFLDQKFLDAYRAQQPAMDAAVKDFEDRYKREHHTDSVPYEAEIPLQKEWVAKIPRPPFSSLIDHIDHIAKVAGVDHVGLGSDFDGVPALPQGIDSVADLPKITQALLDRGYTPEQVRKILGGNLLRVFRRVEAVSRQMQKEERVAAAR